MAHDRYTHISPRGEIMAQYGRAIAPGIDTGFWPTPKQHTGIMLISSVILAYYARRSLIDAPIVHLLFHMNFLSRYSANLTEVFNC